MKDFYIKHVFFLLLKIFLEEKLAEQFEYFGIFLSFLEQKKYDSNIL